MPRNDQTGPLGKGPIIGRGAGNCGFRVPDPEESGIETGIGSASKTRRCMQRSFRGGPCSLNRGSREEAAVRKAENETSGGPDLAGENAQLSAQAKDLKRRLEILEKKLAGLTQRPNHG
jgi:hypothetical protein